MSSSILWRGNYSSDGLDFRQQRLAINLHLSVFPLLQSPDIAHLKFTVGTCHLKRPPPPPPLQATLPAEIHVYDLVFATVGELL